MNASKTAVITGGAGFIGTHLTRHLLAKGWQLTVLDRDPSEEFLSIKNPALKLIQKNLFEYDGLTENLKNSSVLFHLAAQPSVELCERNQEEASKDNYQSTLFLLSLLEKTATPEHTKKIIFTSTSAVYGDQGDVQLISETLTPKPFSHYGKDKLRSEKAIFDAVRKNPNLGCRVFRLFNVYGQGQKAGSAYTGVITKFAENLKQKKNFIIHGSGEQVRDFIHVEDVVKALALGAEAELQGVDFPMNVATGKGISILQLANLFLKNSGLSLSHSEPRIGDIFFSIGDSSRLQKTLSWKPSVDITQGITDFIAIR